MARAKEKENEIGRKNNPILYAINSTNTIILFAHIHPYPKKYRVQAAQAFFKAELQKRHATVNLELYQQNCSQILVG